MPKHELLDPDFESRVRISFDRQGAIISLGARLIDLIPGEARIEMPFNPSFTQQDGFLHAGIVTTIVDSACGYAAYTLMPAGSRVLTVEYKVNFLSPAKGEKFIAIGKVVKPGRKLTVCSGEVLAYENGEEMQVALMQATMITVK
jgi:uncharacterized protein (TIGR00369 family)